MKQITVLKNFGGKETQERRIQPGVYDVDSPALFGLAQYLVDNGHAVEVKQVAVPVKEATKAVEIQTVSIEPDAPEETGVDPQRDLPETHRIEIDRTGRPAVKPPKGK